MEFFTIWSYHSINFEEEGTINSEEYTEICFNCFKDGELRADVIKSSHMNNLTGNHARRFLYGSDSEECKQVTCSDMNFWLLLFGSVATTDPDLEKDPKGDDHARHIRGWHLADSALYVVPMEG